MFEVMSEKNANCWLHIFVVIFFLFVSYAVTYYVHGNIKTDLKVETSFIPSLPCKGRLLFQASNGSIFELPDRLSVITLRSGSESTVHGVHNGYIVRHDDQMGNLQFICSTGQCGCETQEGIHTNGVLIPESDQEYEESIISDSESEISEGDIISQATTTNISVYEE